MVSILKYGIYYINSAISKVISKVSFYQNTVGGIAHICFKQWFQITADAHPGLSGVSKDQKFSEKFKNTHSTI